MNEFIRELARQADPEYTGRYDDDMGHALVGDEAIQKFALLITKEIVEECAKLCVQHAGWTPRMIAEQVKQHFGVGE